MAELNTAEPATARLSCGTVELVVREIWSEYFDRAVSAYDNFFDLGGDSLAMIDVVGMARDRGLPVRSSMALRNPSPSRLAEALTVHAADPAPVAVPALADATAPRAPVWTDDHTAFEPVASGAGTPLYVVHSESHVAAERDAVASWGTARPVTGIPLPGYRGPIPPFATLGELADRILPALPRQTGPYHLAGFGFGAPVALELARGLTGRGATVALLALVRPPAPVPGADARHDRIAALARRFGLDGTEDLDEIHARLRHDGWYDDGVAPADLPRLQQLWADLAGAARSHRPGRYDGPAVLVHDVADPADDWSGVLPGQEAHAFDHGIDSPMAILRDERLVAVMRRALES